MKQSTQSSIIGSVSRVGDQLIVKFNYTPQRVAAIKTFPRSRYEPKSRSWQIPAGNLPLLEKSPHFNRRRLEYDFAPSAGYVPTDSLTKEAIGRWKRHPLKVDDKDLPLIRADLVVQLNSTGRSVLATFSERAALRQFIESTGISTWSKQDDAFVIDPARVGDLVRFCRSRNITFAVTAAASTALSESADLRTAIVEGRGTPSADELEKALLYPFLTRDGDTDRLDIIGLTREQRDHFGIDVEVSLSPDELLRLSALAESENITIWVDRSCAEAISKITDHDSKFSVEKNSLKLATQFQSAVSWGYCELTRRGGLSINNEFAAEILSSKPELQELASRLTHNHTVRFIPVPDDELSELYEQNPGFPVSANFKQFVEIIRYRKELSTQRRYYQKLTDADLSAEPFTDRELISKMYPHQRVAVKWILDTPRAFLGDDMGLGKTLSVLASFDVLKNRGDVDFMVVIAPTSLTRNWIIEAESWTPGTKLNLISGSKKEKLMAIKQIGWGGVKSDGLVLNYESIRLDYIRDEISALLKKKNALLVIDESQRVKNPRGETFKSFSSLARLTNRRILLSGTPTPKDISDIWTQYYLLDDGERFGRNFYRWLETIADLGNKYSAVAVNTFKPEQVKETIRRAQEIMLRRKKDEVLNLPQKIFTTRYVKLVGEQAKRYDEIRKDLLLRMTSVNGKAFIRAIDSILEEYLRAVQVASNPRLIDKSWTGEPAKFKELDSIVEEIVKERDEKLVIWTNYILNTKELATRYAEFGAAEFSGEIHPEKRTAIVSQFQNDPSCKILIAVPAAGGVGITLTAAQTAVYIDKTWNGEHWMQSVDRLHRIGQTGTVNIISISACKIDELISGNLYRKVRLQREVLGDNVRAQQDTVSDSYALPSLEDLKEALAG